MQEWLFGNVPIVAMRRKADASLENVPSVKRKIHLRKKRNNKRELKRLPFCMPGDRGMLVNIFDGKKRNWRIKEGR